MDIKLLIAEDDANLQRMWMRGFEAAGGFSVEVASHGEEALSALQVALPDVIVADYQMPLMNGVDLIRELRAMPGGENVRVIMITANDGVRFHEGADLADMFLLKPVSQHELIKLTRRLCGSPRVAKAS